MAGYCSDVLGPSEKRTKRVPGLSAELSWSFNDRDGMILRFYDGSDLVGERRFSDIIEAEVFFKGLLSLPVQHGPPGPQPVAGIASYWLAGGKWMVQVGNSVADELGNADLDRVAAAQDAGDIATAALS